MTAHLDTNALLAAVVPDRSRERALIVAHAREHGPLIVDESVLVETCWVLESSYKMDRSVVAEILQAVLQTEELIAWDPPVAEQALRLAQQHPRLGIVDCIVAARALDGDVVLTFDRRLARTIESL